MFIHGNMSTDLPYLCQHNALVYMHRRTYVHACSYICMHVHTCICVSIYACWEWFQAFSWGLSSSLPSLQTPGSLWG